MSARSELASPAARAAATWCTHGDLPAPARAEGLLLISPLGDTAVPLGPDALELAGATLAQAGLAAADRVVVALNNDGDLAGALLAQAAAGVAGAAAAAGPRGRMRLFQTLRALGATVLVATPTGAMDLLARLHLEFLVDPLDLGLRRILLTGEIASPGTHRHLAAEFDAEVVEVYTDPVRGVPVATARDGLLEPVRPGLLGLAPLTADTLLAPPYPVGPAELVSTGPQGITRTGQVVTLGEEAGAIPVPTHTVGDHLLVRGRWLPLSRLTQAISRIDGIGHWELIVARTGTLDQATLRVAFSRASLLRNPMWTRRIKQAVAAVTPVAIEVTVAELVVDGVRPPTVTDRRGQHLGPRRAEVG